MLSRLTGLENPPVLSGSNAPDVTRNTYVDTVGGRGLVFEYDPGEKHIGELEELSGIGRKTREERKAVRAQKKEARQERRAERKETRQEKRVERKEHRAEKKAGRQEKRAERREKRGGTVVKKIALAPVRGAFLSLLLINFRDLAARLKSAIQKNPNEVKKLSLKFGFNWEKFQNAILKGSTKKPIFGKGKIGAEPVTLTVTGATVATAAPLIIASVALFRALGIGKKEGSPPDDQTIKEATDVLTSAAGGSPAEVTAAIEKATDILKDPNSTAEERQDAKEAIEKAKSGGTGGIIEWAKENPLPAVAIGGAIAWGIFKLTSKK